MEFVICESEFINITTFWNSNYPIFSQCFQDTALAWTPVIVFFFICLPLELVSFKSLYHKQFGVEQISWNWFNSLRTAIVGLFIAEKSIQSIYNLNVLCDIILDIYQTNDSNVQSSIIKESIFTNQNIFVISSFIKPIIQVITFTCLLVVYLEQRKLGKHTSGPIWAYVFLQTGCSVATVVSLILNDKINNSNNYIENSLDYYFKIVFFVLIIILFILECIGDKPNIPKHLYELNLAGYSRPIPPELSASFCSKLTIWWLNSFVLFGYKTQLQVSLLWQTLHHYRASYLTPKFLLFQQQQHKASLTTNELLLLKKKSSNSKKNSTTTRNKYFQCADGSLRKKSTLWLVLLHLYWPRLLTVALFRFIQIILAYSVPIIFKQVLYFLDDNNEPFWHGLLYVAGLFVVPLIQSISSAHYFCECQQIGLNMKTTLSSAIYRKSLLLSKSSRVKSTSGEMINLIAVDSQRVHNMMVEINLVWSCPFQICISVWLLYLEFGWTIFAGLASMILVLPINILITRRMKLNQVKLLHKKDERIEIISEILTGIKVIKLYAWENSFMNRLFNYRKRELQLLRKITNLDAGQTFIWATSPFLIAVITLSVYLGIDSEHILTAKKAFVAIAIFNLLKTPLSMISDLVTNLLLGFISLKRIERFLNSDELTCYVTRNKGPDAISIEEATVSWFAPNEDTDGDNSKNKKSMRDTTTKGSTTADRPTEQPKVNSDTHTLKNISMHIKEGSLVAIVGQVASGKSSLLAAMLGEMHRTSGRFNIARDKRIAYVPQQAWIQNLSIINNILFSQRFDEDLYRQTVSVCALQPDFDSFPDGDNSEVGESGLNLSGGQKQRVSLARAVYSQSDIYLFDDPLSALDSHIAKHVFDKVISSTSGMLRKTTRVLATNSLFVLPQVDQIFLLDEGKIVESGTYEELIKIKNGRFSAIMQGKPIQASRTKADAVVSLTSKDLRCQQTTYLDISPLQNDKGLSFEKCSQRNKKTDSTHCLKKQKDAQLTKAESIEIGRVNMKVYYRYFEAVSRRSMLFVCYSIIAASAFHVASGFWISTWTSSSNRNSANNPLIVYACLGGLQCFSNLLGTFALAIGSVRGASRFHSWLLNSIMHSSSTEFFDRTPTGRIVNRFAKDIDVIDLRLPRALRDVLTEGISVASTIFVIIYSIPSFILIILPLTIFFLFIQRIYIATSRQLQRLESVTRSPIYSNFGETLSGASVIRAYNKKDEFTRKNDELIDENQSCSYPSIVATRWLSMRLEILGSLVTSLIGLYGILNKAQIYVGTVGLAISFTLNITHTLGHWVRMSSELENYIVSVERILEYMANEPEDDWTKPSFTKSRGANWPTDGTISFVDYSTRYRKETSLVLKEISFDVKSCEKIGIVGRTGSGKSSLSLALFRILEPSAGRIIIDGANIADCGLHDLRSRLTIIPQDAVLFSGTLRFNLDPLQLYSDEQIWRALELSHLKAYVSNLNDGLEYKVSEYGDNFSHGQRQLVCLARAVLRNSKIIILDEATAAVDVETDELIQKTIRKQFKQSTILTIAHRLETILDSDRILVLDSGRVCEMDSPLSLAANRESMFASLIRAAGIDVNRINKF